MQLCEFEKDAQVEEKLTKGLI